VEVLLTVVRDGDVHLSGGVVPKGTVVDVRVDQGQDRAVDRLPVARHDPFGLPEVVEPPFLPGVAFAGAAREVHEEPVVVPGDVLLVPHALDLKFPA
jgi:hypothetical protein